MVRKRLVNGLSVLAAAIAIGLVSTSAAEKTPPETPLTETGQKLLAQYTDMFQSLKTEITKALPNIDEQKKAALQKAREAVKKAETEATATQQALAKIQGAKGLVDHAKGKWIGGAEKGIAQAEAALKKATTDAEREAAKKELAKWQANDSKEPVEIVVPYTCDQWKQTQPVELALAEGKDVLHFAVQDGSRGVSIKEFTLTPMK